MTSLRGGHGWLEVSADWSEALPASSFPATWRHWYPAAEAVSVLLSHNFPCQQNDVFDQSPALRLLDVGPMHNPDVIINCINWFEFRLSQNMLSVFVIHWSIKFISHFKFKYYVQTVYTHAWSGIWSCSAVLIWHDGACVSTCWPISSALSAQGCLRHAANTHDVWFQIVFVCRPVRVEPTTCRHLRDLTVSTFKQHLKTHLFNIAYFY